MTALIHRLERLIDGLTVIKLFHKCVATLVDVWLDYSKRTRLATNQVVQANAKQEKQTYNPNGKRTGYNAIELSPLSNALVSQSLPLGVNMCEFFLLMACRVRNPAALTVVFCV